MSPDLGDPRNEGGEWAQGPCLSVADSITSLYRRDGGVRLPGLVKRGLMGSFSSKNISEVRGYLKISTLSLGIRKCTLAVTRTIKVRNKGLSDKGGPGEKGRHLCFSPNAKADASSLVTLEVGAYWGIRGGCYLQI